MKKQLIALWVMITLTIASTVFAADAQPEPGVFKRRLIDVTPADATLIASIPDVVAAAKTIRQSKLLKIFDDPAYRPFTDDITAFYRRKFANDLPKELEAGIKSLAFLNINKNDLASVLNGELTLVILDEPFANPAAPVPDVVIAIDVEPKLALALGNVNLLSMRFQRQIKQMNITFETTDASEGVKINMLKSPLLTLAAPNTTPCWAVSGNRLLIATRNSTLSQIIKAMTDATAIGGSYGESDRMKTISKSIDGQPLAVVQVNIDRLQKLLPVINQQVIRNAGGMFPNDFDLFAPYRKFKMKTMTYAIGVDSAGLFRETVFMDVEPDGLKLARPLPKDGGPVPPRGSLVSLGFNIDVRATWDLEMEVLDQNPMLKLVLERLREREKEIGVSLVDIINDLDGETYAYAALPYSPAGHLAHFLPDIIVKTKVKSPAVAEKLNAYILKMSADQRERFFPIEIHGLKGISLRREKNRMNEIEPTLVLDGDWLVLSIFSPQGIIRAKTPSAAGPLALGYKPTGFEITETETLISYVTVDVQSALAFLYNLADFGLHVERVYPPIDFHQLPAADVLAAYFSPISIVSTIDGETLYKQTIISPTGTLPGIAMTGLVAYWAKERSDERRVETKIAEAKLAVETIGKRIQTYKAERGALPNQLADIYNAEEDGDYFFFGNMDRNRWRANAELKNNNNRERFETLHALEYDPTADGNVQRALLTVKADALDRRLKERTALMGDGTLTQLPIDRAARNVEPQEEMEIDRRGNLPVLPPPGPRQQPVQPDPDDF